MYVLVEVIDRDIILHWFRTKEKADKKLKELFDEATGDDQASLIENEEAYIRIDTTSFAWANVKNYNFDWYVEEVPTFIGNANED